MQLIHKFSGKKITIIGHEKSKIDGSILLFVKGWGRNERIDLSGVTTLNGQPVTDDMFVIKKTPIQERVELIMQINYLSRNPTTGRMLAAKAEGFISEIQIAAGSRGLKHVATHPNQFVADVADSIMKFGKCSEKQAYILAKYADEVGIKP